MRRPIDVDIDNRVHFATLVLSTAGDNLRLGASPLLFAEDSNGQIRSLMVYFMDDGNEASLAGSVVDPRLQLGVPGYSKYRGIGTAMVAVFSRKVLQLGKNRIVLHPLDKQAERFWKGRGFVQMYPTGSHISRNRSGCD